MSNWNADLQYTPKRVKETLPIVELDDQDS